MTKQPDVRTMKISQATWNKLRLYKTQMGIKVNKNISWNDLFELMIGNIENGKTN